MLAEPTELITPDGTTVERVPTGPAPPTVSVRTGEPAGAPYAGYPQPTAPPPFPLPPPSGPPPPGGPLTVSVSRLPGIRAWGIAAAAAVLVAAVAVVAVVLVRAGRADDQSGAVASTAQALPPTAAGSAADSRAVAPPRQSKAHVPPAGGRAGGGVGTEATATTATTTVTTVAPVAAPTRLDIGCDQGYIVQVASEIDQPSFDRRIAELTAAGQLPAGLRWAETGSSCKIFTSQVNVLVLYAGPFASPADACPARLLSPADAFVKSTTPGATTVISCVCPADPNTLPAITTVGQHEVWVGELQRLLGGKLDYDVGAINADPAAGNPGSWGIYTEETAAAIGRFQADNNLPGSRQVDAATWSVLRARGC